MPTRVLLEGPAIEPLLAQVREEYGSGVRIISADKVRSGGFGGFFAKQHYELSVEVPDDTDDRTDMARNRSAADPAPQTLEQLLARAEARDDIAVPSDDGAAPERKEGRHAGISDAEAAASGMPPRSGLLSTSNAFAELMAGLDNANAAASASASLSRKPSPRPGPAPQSREGQSREGQSREADSRDGDKAESVVRPFRPAAATGSPVNGSSAKPLPPVPSLAELMGGLGLTDGDPLTAPLSPAPPVRPLRSAAEAYGVPPAHSPELNGRSTAPAAESPAFAAPAFAAPAYTPSALDAPGLPTSPAAAPYLLDEPSRNGQSASVAPPPPPPMAEPEPPRMVEPTRMAEPARPAEPVYAAEPIFVSTPPASPAAEPLMPEPAQPTAAAAPAPAQPANGQPANGQAGDGEPSMAQRLAALAKPLPVDPVVGNLMRVGMPAELAATITGGDTYAGVLTALASRPAAPAIPDGPGEILVLVGELPHALASARQCLEQIGLDQTHLLLAGPSAAGTGIHSSKVIPGPEDAARRTEKLHTADSAWVVAMDAPVGATDSAWVRETCEAIGATAVWAVVDATRKTADTARHLKLLGEIEALVVHGVENTSDPATVLGLDYPIVSLDGRPATPHAWAAMLCARIATDVAPIPVPPVTRRPNRSR